MSATHADDRDTIAVLGATGAAGRAAVRALSDPSLFDRGAGTRPAVLRLGGRRPDALSALAESLPTGPGRPRIETGLVDLHDDADLIRFCSGARVVLSCAGPSYTFGDRIARVAHETGADLADVSGYDPVYSRLVALDPAARGRAAVLSAGIYPGLSIVLPRWLAGREPGRPRRLTAYVGGIEEATVGSSADLVLSIGDGAVWGSSGAALAAWRDGRRREHTLRVVEDAEIPFFPDRLTAQPFLSSEAERLAESLGLDELDWYNVFIGTHMRGVLNRLRTDVPSEPAEIDRRARELVRACALDVGGRDSYYVMAYWLDVQAPDGTIEQRSAVLRTRDTFEVTGAVGAMAAADLWAGLVEPGVHFAAATLDPDDTVERVRALPSTAALDAFTVTEGRGGAPVPGRAVDVDAGVL